MGKYMVFYQKIPADVVRMFNDDVMVMEADIPKKYAYMATVEARDLEDVFAIMNGMNLKTENPLESKMGQALVEMTGVGHTSMSVNDLIMDLNTQTIYQVQGIGFRVVGIF